MTIKKKLGFTFNEFVKLTDSYIFDENKSKFEKLPEETQKIITKLANYDYEDFKGLTKPEANILRNLESTNG